jgi:hypothetical protein
MAMLQCKEQVAVGFPNTGEGIKYHITKTFVLRVWRLAALEIMGADSAGNACVLVQ